MQHFRSARRLVGMVLIARGSAAAGLLSAVLAVAVSAVVAAAPADAVPTINAATTHLTSAFSHDLTSVTIAKGQSITAYGHLQDAYYRSLPGYVVSLYARTDPSKPWTDLRGNVSDFDGKVSLKVTPNYSTQLQWRFAGASGRAASVSPILNLTIGVPPTFMSTWDDAGPGLSSLYVVKGRPTKLVAYLADRQFLYRIPGATVTLLARGDATKPWTQLETLVTGDDGRVSQMITPNYNVQLEWRYDGSAVHGSSTSPIISLVLGPAPTVISITGSLALTKGQSTTVAGHLRQWQNGDDVAGATLDLYARANAEASWVKIKTLITNSEGKVSQLVTPNYQVQLEWRYPGSDSYRGSTSTITTISVNPPA